MTPFGCGALGVALLHWRGAPGGGEGGVMRPHRSRPVPVVPNSAFVGFRFPPEVIVLALRWHLRYGLSYRDVQELLAERAIEVHHVTIYRNSARSAPRYPKTRNRPERGPRTGDDRADASSGSLARRIQRPNVHATSVLRRALHPLVLEATSRHSMAQPTRVRRVFR